MGEKVSKEDFILDEGLSAGCLRGGLNTGTLGAQDEGGVTVFRVLYPERIILRGCAVFDLGLIPGNRGR